MNSQMSPKDRIIVALDVDSVDKATTLVEELSLHVGMFKIGLQFIHAMLAQLIVPDKAAARKNLTQIRKLYALLDGKIFWDGKFNDIPNTVGKASAEVAKLGVKMFNVHVSAGFEAMQTAVARKGGSLVLAVTVLTSLNLRETEMLYVRQPHEIVSYFARYAQRAGFDGAIASPHEIKIIREECGRNFIIATPGIRPSWAQANDQKRTSTPAEAITAGADYLVIGRPITYPPFMIGKPEDAAIHIAKEIAEAIATRPTEEAEMRTGC